MSYKIIKNKDSLRKKTEPVVSVEEGQEIANKLLQAMGELNFCLGLSANQIGIQKSVSVVRVKKDSPPIILMNPVITETSNEKIVYLEGCLSLPGKQTRTIRSLKIKVSTLNHANILPFGPDTEPLTQESIATDYGVLESVCVQHEIDHLRGVLMVDDGVRFDDPKPPRVIKHGRNDKVMIEKDGEMQYIKYKKALEFINNGWKLK
jgi:peptide deformylase